MNKLGKIWTDSVAYVALIMGAGLSVAGNVADTYRTRGAVTDVLDVVLAVAWPALVVLMVELFVSTRWVGTGRPMQAIRWVGTVGIGLMAMRVSWVHLNDLMLSRGQQTDVSILGPLSIDSLAIMATALILSGRVSRPLSSVSMDTWTGPVASVQDVAESEAAMAGWTGQDVSWLDRLGAELDSSTTPATPLDTVDTSRTSNEVRSDSVPTEASQMIRTWDGQGPKGALDRTVAHTFGVTPRTARRWRYAVTGAPVSAPPAE